MSAHYESAPVLAKNATTAAVILMAEIIVSFAVAPVLADDAVAIGAKLAICLGITAMWSVFCVYASKALEAGYMTVMELAAHPPAPVPVEKPLAKAS